MDGSAVPASGSNVIDLRICLRFMRLKYTNFVKRRRANV
jgi:hypothetical protein